MQKELRRIFRERRHNKNEIICYDNFSFDKENLINYESETRVKDESDEMVARW